MNMKLIYRLNIKIVVCVVLSLVFNAVMFSQEPVKDAEIQKKVKEWNEVEVHPEFPGGIEKFYKFIGNNFKMSDKKLSGKVVAKFIIEIDGSLSNFEIIKNEVDTASGEELIRVLKKSPKWVYDLGNEQPVRVFFSIPITLQAGM